MKIHIQNHHCAIVNSCFESQVRSENHSTRQEMPTLSVEPCRPVQAWLPDVDLGFVCIDA